MSLSLLLHNYYTCFLYIEATNWIAFSCNRPVKMNQWGHESSCSVWLTFNFPEKFMWSYLATCQYFGSDLHTPKRKPLQRVSSEWLCCLLALYSQAWGTSSVHRSPPSPETGWVLVEWQVSKTCVCHGPFFYNDPKSNSTISTGPLTRNEGNVNYVNISVYYHP